MLRENSMTKSARTRTPAIAKAALALAALATALACATTPAGPPPFDPVGSFEYTAYVEGQPLSGTMTIEEVADGYEGTILSAAFPPIPITSVTVAGSCARRDHGLQVVADLPLRCTDQGVMADYAAQPHVERGSVVVR